MSLFNFPFFRKSLPTIGNPVAIDDILAGNQLTIDGLSAITGLPNPGFAIISGMQYTPAIGGTPSSYAPGIFWLNGFFYYMNANFSENIYLIPSLVDTNVEQYSDFSLQATYTQYLAAPTSASTSASTPIWQSTMNAYRIDNTTLNTAVQSLLTTVASLGPAAYAQIGISAGTVAAGNDARFGYTVAAANALFATMADVLLTTTAGSPGTFTPVQPNHPATKSYVDATTAGRLASGTASLGTLTSGGAAYTIPLGTTLGANTYRVDGSLSSSNSTHLPGGMSWHVISQSTTSFVIWVYPAVSIFSSVSFSFIVWAP